VAYFEKTEVGNYEGLTIIEYSKSTSVHYRNVVGYHLR